MAGTMIVPRRQLLQTWGIGATAAGVILGLVLVAHAGSLKASAGDDLFTNAAIRHLRIEINSGNMKILRAPVARERTHSERPSVPATVLEGDSVWTNVAIHLKGSLGSFRRVDDKPALTLNFDKLADKQRFHGLQKISLNNSVQDPSFVSEKICRELYAAGGVPVPRVDYATVELNGRKLGLYVLAEGWNKQFLHHHFTNVKGNFYDPGSQRDLDRPLEAAFGQNPNDHAALNALRAGMNVPDHTERLARLRATVDVERLLSMHALDVLMWNWDGYGMDRNNFRLFHDLDANWIVFFPHGVDQMFWKPNGPIMTGRAGLVVKSWLETAEGRRLYLERFTQLRANVFDQRAITNRIAELTARLRPALQEQGMFAVSRQQQAAQRLRNLVVARARDVDAQLASVKSFTPIALNAAIPLTGWKTQRDLGDVSFIQTTNFPPALRLVASGSPGFGCWTTTVWLEEGRYRIEGRVKTLGVESNTGREGGAGFRVWSSRKETRGASWDWFPYNRARDPQHGGLIPVLTRTPLKRLKGDTKWTTVTYEFELRQPLADLQIQCALEASAGAAWFDLSSLKIRRVALNVSRTTSRAD